MQESIESKVKILQVPSDNLYSMAGQAATASSSWARESESTRAPVIVSASMPAHTVPDDMSGFEIYVHPEADAGKAVAFGITGDGSGDSSGVVANDSGPRLAS